MIALPAADRPPHPCAARVFHDSAACQSGRREGPPCPGALAASQSPSHVFSLGWCQVPVVIKTGRENE